MSEMLSDYRQLGVTRKDLERVTASLNALWTTGMVTILLVIAMAAYISYLLRVAPVKIEDEFRSTRAEMEYRIGKLDTQQRMVERLIGEMSANQQQFQPTSEQAYLP